MKRGINVIEAAGHQSTNNAISWVYKKMPVLATDQFTVFKNDKYISKHLLAYGGWILGKCGLFSVANDFLIKTDRYTEMKDLP